MDKQTKTATPPPPDPARLKTFDEVLGHERLCAYLKRAWGEERLPQVLLLTGPPGVGKMTLAFALMREVVTRGEEPATSRYGMKLGKGIHPDVIELRPQRSIIKVDDVRAMEEKAYYAPLESPRKFVLIEPADALNSSSANALLKLLEEPPKSLIFILIAAEASRLLPTIRSRATTLPLEPVVRDHVEEWLKGQKALTGEQAKLIATLSEGRPGYALRLAEAGLLKQREMLLNALQLLIVEGFASVFGVAETMLKLNNDPIETLTAMMLLLRDAMVLKTGGSAILNQDLTEGINTFAQGANAEGLLLAAESCEKAMHEMPYYYLPGPRQHAFELLAIELGRQLKRR